MRETVCRTGGGLFIRAIQMLFYVDSSAVTSRWQVLILRSRIGRENGISVCCRPAFFNLNRLLRTRCALIFFNNRKSIIPTPVIAGADHGIQSRTTDR